MVVSATETEMASPLEVFLYLSICDIEWANTSPVRISSFNSFKALGVITDDIGMLYNIEIEREIR